MTPEFSLSPATEGDAAVICRLAHQIWPATYHFLPEGQVPYMLNQMYAEAVVRDQIVNKSQHYLLLRAEAAEIGFASYSIAPGQATAKLNKLYLLASWQGRGLGKLMLKKVAKKAKNAGCHTLFLNVNRYNPAFAFYKSAGFTVAREEDIPIGPYFMNDYLMQKQL